MRISPIRGGEIQEPTPLFSKGFPSYSFERIQDRLNNRFMETIEQLNDIIILQSATINELEKRIILLEDQVYFGGK